MTDVTSNALGNPAFKVRSPVAVIVFSIITLGIYYLYWVYQVGREMKEYNGSGIGPVANLLIGIIFGVVLAFTIPNDVQATYARDGKEAGISALTGFWNLLPLIGSIIWVVKVQGRLNALWEGRA